ncbi:MAG: MFS transporter [SAR202 cluster bacterium]|nr:MFS transporter [SAR202 cluster bacterium]
MRYTGRMDEDEDQGDATRADAAKTPPEPRLLTPRVRGSGARVRATSTFRQTFKSLENRDFRYLWLGMLAMMSSIQMAQVSTGYLVYDITGSASLLGLVSAAQAAPMLLLSPFGGAVADRFERKRVIQAGQAVAGILGLVVALSISLGWVTWVHLLAVSLVYGVVFSFTMPSRQSLIPQLVEKDQLTNAMALNGTVLSATYLVAPAIAGGLYALVGPTIVFYIIAGLGFVAVALTGFLPNRPGSGEGTERAMLRDIGEGLRYILRDPLIRVILVMTIATTLLSMPFRYVAPAVVVDVYHRGPDSLGLLISIMGLGSVVGSLVIASVGRWKRGLLLIAAGLPSGIALVVVASVPIYVVAVVIMLMLGVGEVMRRTLTHSLMIEHADEKYRGRVISIYLTTFGLVPLAVFPAGVAIEYIGARETLGFLGGGLLLVTAVLWFTQRKLRAMP